MRKKIDLGEHGTEWGLDEKDREMEGGLQKREKCIILETEKKWILVMRKDRKVKYGKSGSNERVL